MFEAEGQIPDVSDYVKPAFWRMAVMPKDPLCKHWTKAMQEEWDKMLRMKVFEYVTIDEAKADPNYHKPFPQTWDLKIKRDKDNRPYELKARLCLRGDLAYDGITKQQVYSPTASYEGVRAIIALAAYRNLELKQLDISSAFLNSSIPEGQSLYCEQPPGPAIEKQYDEQGRLKVMRALKYQYGHAMAPAAFNRTLTAHLREAFDMDPLKSEPCLFSKTVTIDGKEESVWCACFVDDVLYTSTSPKLEKEFYDMIQSRFDIKQSESGLATWILGMAVDCKKSSTGDIDSYVITSKAHIEKLVDFMGLNENDLADTPLESDVRLPTLTAPEDGINPNNCVGPHQRSMLSVIGSILFIALTTRPDVCYACSMLARHAKNPGAKHVEQLIRIVKYLNRTKDLGITFRRKGTLPNQPMASAFQSGIHPLDVHKQDPLRAYADADFAGTTGNCKRSTTGFVICFYGGPIYWASRLQGVTAQSTAESECISAVDCTKALIHTRLLIRELGFPTDMDKPTIIHEDNSSCVAFSENLKSRRTTRHFELRVHFLQEQVRNNVVKFVQTPTKFQCADIFTKSLNLDTFRSLRDQLLGTDQHLAILHADPIVAHILVQQGGGVILNDKDREQNHTQSEDIQLDTVQNSTIGVDASAADLLHALSSKAPKQIKQKPVIDAKQVVSETGYLPMAACILQEARKKYSKHSVNERVTLDTSAYTTKFAYSIHEETAYG